MEKTIHPLRRDVGEMEESHLVDRISDLPDLVTSNILSRLPTIQATRTCALSRDWKHKWTSIYDIDINARDYVSEFLNLRNEPEYLEFEARLVCFQSFVDKALESLSWLSIRSAKMVLGDFETTSHSISRWISRLVTLHVKNLTLTHRGPDLGIVLPRELECCTSLTELRLSLDCYWEVRTDNYFPNIECLYLSGDSSWDYSTFRIVNKQSVKGGGQLSLYFPVLKILQLGPAFDFVNENLVEIDVPELISFKILWPEYLSTFIMKIRSPKLERFVTNDGPLFDFVVPTPSLRYVHSYGGKALASQLIALLKGAPNLECLCLVRNMADQALPSFNQLKQLKLLATSVKELWKFLQATPNLESLAFSVYEENLNQLPEPWPACTQLKQVTFQHLKGTKTEFALARIFLEKAKKLKRVVVDPIRDDDITDAKIKKWMKSLGPKKSRRVTVEYMRLRTLVPQDIISSV